MIHLKLWAIVVIDNDTFKVVTTVRLDFVSAISYLM